MKKILAMIPARRGSVRLKQKNLALLDGKPLISYAIDAAKKSNIFSRIVVNSEDKVFSDIAKRFGIDFYQRPEHLATSETKSDEVVDDFMTNNACDIVVWVNPTSPLQPSEEIRQTVEYFLKEGLDSLITTKDEQVHCIFEGKPLNFTQDELFARTQDLEAVQPFVYSIMMWRTKSFQKKFKNKGCALLCGKFGTYSVGKLSSIIIKREEDLRFAEYVLTGMKAKGDYILKYDKAASHA